MDEEIESVREIQPITNRDHYIYVKDPHLHLVLNMLKTACIPQHRIGIS